MRKQELIRFLGNQPTGSAEFIVAKIALEHRVQKTLIWPNWIVAGATIATLLLTGYQIFKIEQRISKIEASLSAFDSPQVASGSNILD